MKKLLFILVTTLIFLTSAHTHAQIAKTVTQGMSKAAAGVVIREAITAKQQIDAHTQNIAAQNRRYARNIIIPRADICFRQSNIRTLHPHIPIVAGDNLKNGTRQIITETEVDKTSENTPLPAPDAQEKSVEDSNSVSVTTTNDVANIIVSENASSTKDNGSGIPKYVIYGGLGIIALILLGFLAFIVYDNYYEPTVKNSHMYGLFSTPQKAERPRVWYVNPNGEVTSFL